MNLDEYVTWVGWIAITLVVVTGCNEYHKNQNMYKLELEKIKVQK